MREGKRRGPCLKHVGGDGWGGAGTVQQVSERIFLVVVGVFRRRRIQVS